MAKKLDLSVIITTKNEATNLPRLLTSLQDQAFDRFETIVVDNYSTDETETIAKRFTSRVYTTGGERSRQRNFGARKARGKFLLFLDADMELPATVIAECMTKFRNHHLVALIIPETVRGKGFFTHIKRLEKELYLNEPTIEAPRAFLKQAFFKIGGYNGKLVAGEDWDLGLRIKKTGKIGRITTSLWHYETSLWRELKHKWYYARNIENYNRLNPDEFNRQRGWVRMFIFWKKRRLLLSQPLTSVELIIIKGIELLLYYLVQVIKI